MKPNKKLLLRRESVTELTPDQLRGVSGADSLGCHVTNITCVRCPSIPFTNCTVLQETDSVTCPTDVC